MHPGDDKELLRQYLEGNDEQAFALLVSRHVNMVYSVALRHVRNPHQAEEITQAVFAVLARKARSLGRKVVISGWLFHAARLTASNFVRNEYRRIRREQEAYMQSQLSEQEQDEIWQEIAPLLDGAIGSLSATDRDAIVLRFLEGRDLKGVGAALGTNEQAAKKRVARAVEKLRGFFARKSFIVSASVLTATIAAHAAQAAPAGLASSATALATLPGTAGASTLALINGTLKIMLWGKIKAAAGMCAGVALAAGTTVLAVTEFQNNHEFKDDGRGLTTNSPFVLHLSNPPWIKNVRFVESMLIAISAQPGDPNPVRFWMNQTNEAALQPGGHFHETVNFPPGTPNFRRGGRQLSGVDDSNFWTAFPAFNQLNTSPVRPQDGGSAANGPQITLGRLRATIEKIRNFGLPALRPGSFQLVDSNRFTAITSDGEALEGKILGAAAGRPLSLSYHFGNSPAYDTSLKYRYPSKKAELPDYIESIERTNGVVLESPAGKVYGNRTNRILHLEYGKDASAENGYPLTRFFTDLGQFTSQQRYSNGLAFNWDNAGKVWHPAPSPEELRKRMEANQQQLDNARRNVR